MRIPMRLTALLLAGTPAVAHFGMVIPSDAMLSQDEGRAVQVLFAFGHPMMNTGMELLPPEVTVTHDGTAATPDLTAATPLGTPGFTADIALDRPGAHMIAMTPQPYWEPSEDSFIQHFTKTVVAAYDDDSGWDALAGLPIEIEPLTRPFGIWAGSAFQGRVLLNGEPLPNAEVEIERWNMDGAVALPSPLMETLTIQADADGVFTYVAPTPGWWGFSALTTAPDTLDHEGEAKALEWGGVIWVHFEPWPAG